MTTAGKAIPEKPQFGSPSCGLPAAGEPSRQEKEDESGDEEDGHFRAEMADRLVTPEDFCISLDGPRVERKQGDILHRVGHEEAWEHAAADGGHGEDDKSGKGSELSAGAGDACQQYSESCHGKGCGGSHNDESRKVGEEVEVKDARGPEEHHRELEEGEQHGVDELAGEESGHCDAGGDDAIEGSTVRLVEKAAGGAAGGEEQEHDTHGGGVVGNHRAALLFANSSSSAILLSTPGTKRWMSMVMADDENSFVRMKDQPHQLRRLSIRWSSSSNDITFGGCTSTLSLEIHPCPPALWAHQNCPIDRLPAGFRKYHC
jgi:hypothetical protein